MALWRLYYHLVWGTRERHPLIKPCIERRLYDYIIGKAQALGCIIHAIGGTEDHVHVAASIPPKIPIADFVKSVKGASAHHLNCNVAETLNKFGWQRGYGVFSLGRKQLDDAIAYIQNQKAHHQQGTVLLALERDTDEDDGPQIHSSGLMM